MISVLMGSHCHHAAMVYLGHVTFDDVLVSLGSLHEYMVLLA